jgi:hypothetical protein
VPDVERTGGVGRHELDLRPPDHVRHRPERPGLRRTEEVLKALGKASVLAAHEPTARLVLLTPELPEPASVGGRSLAAVVGDGPGRTVADAIELDSVGGYGRLKRLAAG